MRPKITFAFGFLAAFACIGLPSSSWATVVGAPPTTYTYSITGSYDLLAGDPSYSGTLTVIGPSTDQIMTADITLANPSVTFANITFEGSDGSGGFILDLMNGTLFLSLDLANARDLFGGNGTDVGVGVLLNGGIPVADDFSGNVDVAATPLPAALPLFAGGLGFVGILIRRKKRNARALAV